MGPKVDEPAIVFDYKDGIKIELVPAYEDLIGFCPDSTSCYPAGRGYLGSQRGKVVHTDYDYDAEQITTFNKLSDGYLIPTIKMLKAIKRRFFPKMKSFHLEVLATRVIPRLILLCKQKGYTISYHELVASFSAGQGRSSQECSH